MGARRARGGTRRAAMGAMRRTRGTKGARAAARGAGQKQRRKRRDALRMQYFRFRRKRLPKSPKEPADPFTSLEHQRAGRGVHTYGEAAGLSNSVWKSAVSAGKSTSAGMMIDDAANAANAADRAAQLPASNSYPGARTRPQHNAALDATRPGLRLEAAQPTATLGSASASANLGIADEGTRAAAGINPVMLAYARRLHETYIRADDATPRNPTGHARPRTARETPPQEAPPRFTDSWRGALDSHAAATATTAAAAVARGAAERSPPVGERLRSVVQALQEGPPSLDSDSSAAPTAAAGSSGFGFGGEWSYTSAGLEALFAANATNAPRGGAAPAGDASAELLLSRHLQDATRVAAQAGRTLNPASGALSQPTEVPPAAETIRRAAALATGGEAAPLGSSAARREAGRGGGAATTGAATSGAATMGDGATSATRASGGPLSAGMGDGVTKASPRRRFRCTMCDRRFSSGQALGGHSRMHAMQRRVQDESGR
ncbi:hypothetical protein CLOM_g8715 [Closterium sp. NIES-68]|nr:hypothetical protein CLOM_g8715 [Closterium sp. NIES-68]